MNPPSIEDLISGKNLKPPSTVGGIYLDRRPDRVNHHMRFTYAAPDRWVWLDPTGSSGAITDGSTHVIIEDGVAVLRTNEGTVVTSDRLMNLLNPTWFGWEGGTFGEVSAGEAVGRPAWLVHSTPSQPGKVPGDLAFDQASGVLLFMQGGGTYLGFEEFVIEEGVPSDTFRWEGPIAQRKIGSALVVPDEDGTHTVTWEVDIKSRLTYHQRGPARITKQEALSWGQERAERTHVREDG